MSAVQPLHPYRIPLGGLLLIEASAGTGKTWNITSLYLRQLLERALTVDQILVVTFTRAATDELRQRIRNRLQEALTLLDDPSDPQDPELARWLAERDQPQADARRLRAALASLDGAAIHTIHGFCQRVLTEHAFETGTLFDARFIEDDEPLRQRAAQDFWRRWFAHHTLPDPALDWLLARYPDPTALRKALDDRLDPRLDLQPPAPSLDTLLEALHRHLAELEAAHRALRRHWRPEAEQALRDSTDLNRNSYRPAGLDQAVETLRRLVEADRPLLDPGDKLKLFGAAWITAKTRKGRTPPQDPLYDACQAYLDHLARLHPLLDGLRLAFLQAARREMADNLAQAKAAAGELAFDDLLDRLDQALAGPGGKTLAAHLRRRHPAVMIDEFQDTDATQYRIFRALHGDDPEHSLCLIGDPKQAIYGFRGGDIFTYLTAAREARRHYTLETNWRASPPLVEAINRLYQAHPAPFLQAEIRFRPVQPAPAAQSSPLHLDGRPVPALQIWRLERGTLDEHQGWIKTTAARHRVAQACADHIAWLLRPGRARLGDRPLRPADIALLVRSHHQVPVLRQALAERGIHAVTLGDESVFTSEEAEALEQLLAAIIEWEDEGRLRHALAGPLLGYGAEALHRLLDDEPAWEAVRQRFHHYREEWRRHGFIGAFERLMRREGVAQRLLGLRHGERRLTNLLQLVELLQHASQRHPGLEPLLHWLQQERRQAAPYEAARLRLESDQERVKIITMHASKGLEYPVVYLPFPWDDSRRPSAPWFHHDAQGRPCLHLGGGDPEAEAQARAAALEEDLAERLRLLYVALTRAARLCITTWGKVRGAEGSALGWLLHQGEMKPLDDAELFAPLAAHQHQAPHAIALTDLPAPAHLQWADTAPPTPAARPFRATIPRRWRVQSYSGLVRGLGWERPGLDDPAPTDAEDLADPYPDLPAGSRFGLLFHQLMENLDFRQPRPDELLPTLAPRHGLSELLNEAPRHQLQRLVTEVCQAHLPGGAPPLARIGPQERLDEMEFHFALETFDPRRLARRLAPWPHWQGAFEGLADDAFEGLLHGFIDLVFRHQGRYHLADYKTNRLDDYRPQTLDQTMKRHHYPLQALIYGLALHRHLARRLPGYRPERHLGGVHYLFVRGMAAGSTRGIWHRPLEPALIEALDQALGRRP